MTNKPLDRLAIAVAQLNPVVGDIEGNLARVRDAVFMAAGLGADLVLFTELFIAGYPPEDLVLKQAFQESCRDAVEALAKDTAGGGPAILIGTPWRDGEKLHNAMALLDDGKIQTLRYKADLPNYGVFDEVRVFDAGPMPGPINFRGVRLGVPICEDIWDEEVCECLEENATEIFLVPNGSPYRMDKRDVRLNVVVSRVTETGLPMLYANMVGGQDELVFDGGSFALNADRSLAMQLPAFRETIALTVWNRTGDGWVMEQGEVSPMQDDEAEIYAACVLGLRDYVNKNHFKHVVLGLSGGIDSAICAAMAVDALGAERVHCVMLPYKYTSSRSLDDAAACAAALSVRYEILPIAAPVDGFEAALAEMFAETQPDTTEENLQSRARGTILMAISNKFGSMVVTTGNKSEVSVGYATLYGDMNGGFNPIKDLYKMQVYALSRWRNTAKPDGALGPDGIVIPDAIITRPPTAELREDQTDQDSLPPYETLDDILECLVEKDMSVSDIVARGHEEATVRRIEHLLYIAEYKRRQAAPGVRVTERNFGKDRRYPITNAFRDAAKS